MRKPRVLVFLVCYNAESFIESVLDRIPEDIWSNQDFETEILVIDDQSSDRTFDSAAHYAERASRPNITVLCNERNQGYGGNQKIGYHFAIRNHFDVVALMHGDGQHDPRYLGRLVEPILADAADVVLGSRMLRRKEALKGGMPFYKWIGNQVLTHAQNRVLGSHLAEFHTGYRAYRVSSLAAVPFECNSDYFDFDTDILIQVLDTGQRIREIPVPTHYGEEVSRVAGLKYAFLALKSSLRSRVVRWGIFYHPKFDYTQSNAVYSLKKGYPSSHQFALDRIDAGARVLDIGSGPGYLTRELAAKGASVVSIDREVTADLRALSSETIETDVDAYDFGDDFGRLDTILLLDILEHLRYPERVLRNIRTRFCGMEPKVIITTGNVAFLPLRLVLFVGLFDYGRRGILDLEHTRLFTFSSMRRLFRHSGFDVVEEKGLPVPYPEALGRTKVARFLLALNRLMIRIRPELFSYQMAFVICPRPDLDLLLRRAEQTKKRRLSGPQRGGEQPSAMAGKD